MRRIVQTTLLSLAITTGMTVVAGAQTGPVAQNCTKEIAQFCANKGHGAAQTRTCLQAHRKSLSVACRKALDTTGGGRGRRR